MVGIRADIGVVGGLHVTASQTSSCSAQVSLGSTSLQGNWESFLLTLLQIRLSSCSNFRLKSQIFWGKCECISWSSPEKQEKSGGFPGGLVVKNSPANLGGAGLIPGWRISPGEGNGNLSSILAGKSHVQRNLVGCSPWGCKRVGCDLTTEQQQQHTHVHMIVKAAQVQSQQGWLVRWRLREKLMQIESKDSLLSEFPLPCESIFLKTFSWLVETHSHYGK